MTQIIGMMFIINDGNKENEQCSFKDVLLFLQKQNGLPFYLKSYLIWLLIRISTQPSIEKQQEMIEAFVFLSQIIATEEAGWREQRYPPLQTPPARL